MIWGIGVDLVDLKEFERLFNQTKKNFLDLVFTEKEKKAAETQNDIKKLAGMFALKEAIFKSLNLQQCDLQDTNYFTQIEITHLPCGKPQAHFLGELAKKFPENEFSLFVSLSYNTNLALSSALLEKNTK